MSYVRICVYIYIRMYTHRLLRTSVLFENLDSFLDNTKSCGNGSRARNCLDDRHRRLFSSRTRHSEKIAGSIVTVVCLRAGPDTARKSRAVERRTRTGKVTEGKCDR